MGFRTKKARQRREKGNQTGYRSERIRAVARFIAKELEMKRGWDKDFAIAVVYTGTYTTHPAWFIASDDMGCTIRLPKNLCNTENLVEALYIPVFFKKYYEWRGAACPDYLKFKAIKKFGVVQIDYPKVVEE